MNEPIVWGENAITNRINELIARRVSSVIKLVLPVSSPSQIQFQWRKNRRWWRWSPRWTTPAQRGSDPWRTTSFSSMTTSISFTLANRSTSPWINSIRFHSSITHEAQLFNSRFHFRISQTLNKIDLKPSPLFVPTADHPHSRLQEDTPCS